MSNQQSTTGRIMQTVSVNFCACGKIISDGEQYCADCATNKQIDVAGIAKYCEGFVRTWKECEKDDFVRVRILGQFPHANEKESSNAKKTPE